jgi:hypothetical protein
VEEHISPSRIPAHELWVEMKTRISTRELHFRSGQEEAAVKSIVGLFTTIRELMRKHPNATDFLAVAPVILETIRPYTARWHSLQDENGRFFGPAQRRQFREELQALQPKLIEFVALLNQMSESGECMAPREPVLPTPFLGHPVCLGIDIDRGPRGQTQPPLKARSILTAQAAFREMNEFERQHLWARRSAAAKDAGQLTNGTGLALSGGGIRSATFCLGVVQVLADAKLLIQFDYLSTVSGGGYLGSFLSNQFDAADTESEEREHSQSANPEHPSGSQAETTSKETQPSTASVRAAYSEVFPRLGSDSPAVRHLRNCSKYLLPTTALAQLKLIGLLISGVLATTLLALSVPVACGLAVHLIAQAGWLEDVQIANRMVNVPGSVAAICAGLAALCWLLRPITPVWRSARDGLDTAAAYASVVSVAALIVAAMPWVVGELNDFANWKVTSISIASVATFLSGATVVKAIGAAWKYRRAFSRLFIFSGAILFVIVYLATVQMLGIGSTTDAPNLSIYVGIGLLVWLIWAASINLNLTGLHRYYRDRLASCYLKPPSEGRGIAHPPKLEELAAKLPYHLINTTVNVTSSDNPELRGRGGDFFLMSKGFCGSTITGFQRTSALSRMNSDLDLATAMAISGAAASTNMGWQTMRQYRVLMAIFNIRLGYWMRWRPTTSGWFASNAFFQLARETLGLLREHASTINLSDGGHIENLGAYELIRRRLKFIVCVDGGMDAGMHCADLIRLQRLVAIDLGYRLEFDTADFKLSDTFSSGYGMLVKIDYTPEEPNVAQKELGWILYIKLAMLGTEPNYVLDYRRENPLFPHQSTADQFFDEAQFEAYRKLGETAARSFLSTRFGTERATDFQEWFRQLARFLLRDTDPVFQVDQHPPHLQAVV